MSCPASGVGDALTVTETRMEQNKVILGVETHLDTHVGAVISETGKLLKTLSVSAETQGYLNLLIWPNSFDHRWR